MRNNSLKIFLMGGLGNVFFQLNAASILRAELGASRSIKVTNLVLAHRKLFSNLFGVQDHSALDALESLGFSVDNKFAADCCDLLLILGSKKLKTQLFSSMYFGRQNPRLEAVNDIKAMFSYFQDEYRISHEFVSDLKSRLFSVTNKPEAKAETVVHFRGGDFGLSNDGPLLDYYKRALDGTRECVIVTDDRVRTELYFSRNFPCLQFKFNDSISLLDDLRFLSEAQRLISSNSTFCWWAAEISTAEIIQPKRFYDFRWRPKSIRLRIDI